MIQRNMSGSHTEKVAEEKSLIAQTCDMKLAQMCYIRNTAFLGLTSATVASQKFGSIKCVHPHPGCSASIGIETGLEPF